MPVVLAEFEQLLKDTMGLNAVSIGALSIERAVQERQAACHLQDMHMYREHLRNSPVELQALIEAVVVRETWFFREKEAFAALVRIVQDEWMPQHPREMLRILSLPCATGEEPFSIAMALLDAGVPANRFRIDGIDISQQALDEAKAASYGKKSFRGANLDFRNRHFIQDARGYRVSEAITRQATFEHANIFAPDFLPRAAVYDIVFCRNVLIYFDSDMQYQAITILARLLTKSGYLFVGSSETSLLSSRGFTSAKIPLAFAFRKTGATSIENKSAPSIKPARRIDIAAPPSIVTKSSGIPALPIAPGPTSARPIAKSSPASQLEQATRLADQGRLEQAAALCNEHIKNHGPSAHAFYLLGLIQDAHRDPALAADYYRKVLYLDPSHAEAMIHLACLLEKKGDRTGARLLRARFDRTNSMRETP